MSANQGETIVELRKEARNRRRRIICNNDGCDVMEVAGTDTLEKFLARRFAKYPNTQIDSVFYCTGATTMFHHLTRVGEYYGEFVSDTPNPEGFMDDNSRWTRDNIRALAKAGHDTLGMACEFCRANDLEVFFSLRINDIHDSFLPWELSRWKREHPEVMMGKPADWDTYPETSPRHWWSALDYEMDEVRDKVLGILEETCERYDIDGLELDWFRGPIAFRPSLDLQPVERKHLDLMNDFMRRLRAITERVSQERGRPLLIAARLPLTLERNKALGFDLETWLQEDLLDVLIVASGNESMAMAPEVRQMAALTHRYDVPTYGCITESATSIGRWREQREIVETCRGAAANIWHAGADGVYTYNLFRSWKQASDERFSQLGSPETLAGLDKIYGVDNVGFEKDWPGHQSPGLVAPGRLPIELQSGEGVQLHVYVGENIAANTPAGRKAHTDLRLLLCGLIGTDEITVSFNGQVLGTAEFSEWPDAEAPIWVEMELDASLIPEGENTVRIDRISRAPFAMIQLGPKVNPVVVQRLDLHVRYR